MAQATAPILDSTDPEIPESANYFRLLRYSRPRQTYTPDRLLTAPRQSDMLLMVRWGPE
jgi:hypothetical protein